MRRTAAAGARLLQRSKPCLGVGYMHQFSRTPQHSFFPQHEFVLLPRKTFLRPNEAAFQVPITLNRSEVQSYLRDVYGLKVLGVKMEQIAAVPQPRMREMQNGQATQTPEHHLEEGIGGNGEGPHIENGAYVGEARQIATVTFEEVIPDQVKMFWSPSTPWINPAITGRAEKASGAMSAPDVGQASTASFGGYGPGSTDEALAPVNQWEPRHRDAWREPVPTLLRDVEGAGQWENVDAPPSPGDSLGSLSSCGPKASATAVPSVRQSEDVEDWRSTKLGAAALGAAATAGALGATGGMAGAAVPLAAALAPAITARAGPGASQLFASLLGGDGSETRAQPRHASRMSKQSERSRELDEAFGLAPGLRRGSGLAASPADKAAYGDRSVTRMARERMPLGGAPVFSPPFRKTTRLDPDPAWPHKQDSHTAIDWMRHGTPRGADGPTELTAAPPEAGGSSFHKQRLKIHKLRKYADKEFQRTKRPMRLPGTNERSSPYQYAAVGEGWEPIGKGGMAAKSASSRKITRDPYNPEKYRAHAFLEHGPERPIGPISDTTPVS